MQLRIPLLTLFALIAFAGNSLLCRLALATTPIDAFSFTSVRLMAGAITLYFLIQFQANTAHQKVSEQKNEGHWFSAIALFVYAICFSIAYRYLSAAVGALILFAAVQITMISVGLIRNEKLRRLQILGFVISCIGLVGLLLPGLTAPPLLSAFSMLCAGIAWGIYSLRGKTIKYALSATANNFLKTIPFTIILNLMFLQQINLNTQGIIYAIASGAITSGIGYAIWYSALPYLKSTTAASVQLSVPVIAALGGIIFLGEPLSLRLVIASVAILGGIALVISNKSIQ